MIIVVIRGLCKLCDWSSLILSAGLLEDGRLKPIQIFRPKFFDSVRKG